MSITFAWDRHQIHIDPRVFARWNAIYRCLCTLHWVCFMTVIYIYRMRFTCTVQNICEPWASYQIRKIAGCACAGNAGNVFPRRRFQRKLLVSDPGMHHGTCVTHVPWCMSGSLTCGDGENVPGIPSACAPAILRIWQEAHGDGSSDRLYLLMPRISGATNQYNALASNINRLLMICSIQIIHSITMTS